MVWLDSGHVVVVVPGEEGYSKNWGGKIPNVMDTGENKRVEFYNFININE